MANIIVLIILIINFQFRKYSCSQDVNNVDVRLDTLYRSHLIVGSMNSYRLNLTRKETVQMLVKVTNTTREDRPLFLSIAYGTHTVPLTLPYKEEEKLTYVARYTICCATKLNQSEEVAVILLTHSTKYIIYQLEFQTISKLIHVCIYGNININIFRRLLFPPR